MNQEMLDELVAHTAKKPNIFGVVMCVEKGDDSMELVSAAGNMHTDDLYFIASVTKMYVTTVLFKLRAQRYLQLEDPISKYLPKDMTERIHVLNGIDYTHQITIKHLVSNTSGIPDYFSSDVFKNLVNGEDQSWNVEKTLQVIKNKKPRFSPGQKRKAQYSDTNFQLLGKIIEVVTGESLSSVYQRLIFDELCLEKTHVFDHKEPRNEQPISMYYKSKRLDLPLYISSIPAEGGVVSTAKETMRFLRAYFDGHLFPREELQELQQWNLLFAPSLSFYGLGLAIQPLFLPDFIRKSGLMGHWGQTGAFAFYHPPTDLYFTGTVNQLTGHFHAIRLMSKIIRKERVRENE
ncbi:serine hydrolase domain-containing protein [Caldalkalibacillus uzonensis]|uniref:serine hydrolase domain-containing protein n=1 Tax=Caldalkalibacillus uzonensis TaxID=353224 RepID=UPI0027D84AF3|nr:serine hydrolase domain-containing protein [Caldalkalibacillus uzonensis]